MTCGCRLLGAGSSGLRLEEEGTDRPWVLTGHLHAEATAIGTGTCANSGSCVMALLYTSGSWI
jgi:hypothetical protein